MAKSQGIIPIYDPLRKKLLGLYLLQYSKVFTGEETEHNILFPAEPSTSSVVPLQKIVPVRSVVNKTRKQNDWFMAAVFTQEEIRNKAYAGYPNFYSANEVRPATEWVSCHTNAHQIRIYLGPILRGLMEDFSTGAPDESTYVAP